MQKTNEASKILSFSWQKLLQILSISKMSHGRHESGFRATRCLQKFQELVFIHEFWDREEHHRSIESQHQNLLSKKKSVQRIDSKGNSSDPEHWTNFLNQQQRYGESSYYWFSKFVFPNKIQLWLCMIFERSADVVDNACKRCPPIVLFVVRARGSKFCRFSRNCSIFPPDESLCLTVCVKLSTAASLLKSTYLPAFFRRK